jgi:ssDNA-binding Zn-finger/Zn-ribbon topoisomerase 1
MSKEFREKPFEKRGNARATATVIKTITCPQCHKIFEPSDFTENISSGDGFRRSLSKVVRCPNCNQAIWAEMTNKRTTKKKELPGRYKNFPIAIAGSDSPIYNSGLTTSSFETSPPSTKILQENTDGKQKQRQSRGKAEKA